VHIYTRNEVRLMSDAQRVFASLCLLAIRTCVYDMRRAGRSKVDS